LSDLQEEDDDDLESEPATKENFHARKTATKESPALAEKLAAEAAANAEKLS
jgi:hypothetical protein